MNKLDLENYIASLLNTPDVDPCILSETQEIQLLLKVYLSGLRRETFPINYLLKDFVLEEDIPVQFHTLVAQLAIIKSRTHKLHTEIYIIAERLLNEFKNYFSRP